MPKDNLPVTIDQSLSSTEVLLWLKNPDSVALDQFKAPPEEVAARITERHLAAGSVDELLGAQTSTAGKDYLNKPFAIVSVDWLASDHDEAGSLPIYALMRVTNYDGEMVVLNCGARNIVEKVAIMAERGWFGTWCKITKADRATEAGFYPLDLVSAPGPLPK
jgi:hypothetical protein